MLTVVTGASSGLGLALCEVFLSSGHQVIGTSRREPNINHPRFEYIPLDLSDLSQLEQVFGDIGSKIQGEEKLCVINNAGSLGNVARLSDSPLKDLESIFKTNTIAPIWISGWASSQGISKIDIVNISSGAARSAYEGWGEYCSTKSALRMATQVIGMENSSKENISVLNLEPGVIDTPMQDKVRLSDQNLFPRLSKFKKLHKDGQLLSPELVAKKIYDWVNVADKEAFLEARVEKGSTIPLH